MPVSYVKLFNTLTDSSVWALPDAQRVIWISMLSMANARGNVHASILGVANRARKSVEEVEEALRVFTEPDPYSRTRELEGRRLVEIDGGWHFVTWDKHRGALNAEAERERKRKWWQENRASNTPLAPELAKLDKTSESGSVFSSASLSGSRSDPDPDLTRARDGQAPTPDAHGQRLVYRNLDGWEPPEDVFAAGELLGLSRERIVERIDDLRLGPIGGQRGTFDRTGYVLKLLPKWRAWDETESYKRPRRDRPNQPNAGVTGFENATVIE